MNKALLLITMCCFSLTSCCSVRSNTKEVVGISSNPAGANIYIDGIASGVTPQAYEVESKHTYSITLEKVGYKPENYLLKPKNNFNKLSSNLLFPVGIGTMCAIAMGIALAVTPGSTLGMAPVLIIGSGVAGLLAGGAIGIAGAGIDLYSGKAKSHVHQNIYLNLQPTY